MFVIIPHQSEQLILVRAQKNALVQLYKAGGIWAPLFPLWVVFDDETPFANFDAVKNGFERLVLDKIHADGNTIFFPATATATSGKIVNGKIRAGINMSSSLSYSAHLSAIDATRIIATESFPLDCHIFRIAYADIVEDAQQVRIWRVQKSRWVKCRRAEQHRSSIDKNAGTQ